MSLSSHHPKIQACYCINPVSFYLILHQAIRSYPSAGIILMDPAEKGPYVCRLMAHSACGASWDMVIGEDPESPINRIIKAGAIQAGAKEFQLLLEGAMRLPMHPKRALLYRSETVITIKAPGLEIRTLVLN